MHMKNRRKGAGRILALAVLMTVSSSLPAFAASWKKDQYGWWWEKDEGGYPSNGWQWIDGNKDGIAECYYFDANGYMMANTTTPDGYHVNESGAWTENGTVKTRNQSVDSAVNVPNGSWMGGTGANSGKWWWRNSDGSYPSNCWQWLDGNQDGIAECYYFDASGWAITSGRTPDGYQVDAEGKWLDGQKIRTRKANRTGGNSAGGGNSSSAEQTNSGVDTAWENYSDDSVSQSANDFKNGNHGMMSDSQWEETKAAVEKFKKKYIKAGMSDFEKEIKIIEWLVENCSYESKKDWSRSTAYSCIILGKAQCAGYADAFLQTAKLCGLEVRYVYNNSHAWNLIKLDGDWYHVDVTWEDPLGSNDYGFNHLRNKYINLEDDQIKNASYHRTWYPESATAKGTKYGPPVVSKYLKSGSVDTSLGTSYAERTNKFFESMEKRPGSATIFYTNVNDTADKIVAHMSDLIDNKKDAYAILLRFGDTYNASKTSDYSKMSETRNKIAERAQQKLNEKYGDVVRSGLKLILYQGEGTNGEYYCYDYSNLTYQEGHDVEVPYTLHYVCNGKEMKTDTGVSERNGRITFDVPENYKVKSCKIKKGEGITTSTSYIIVRGRDAIEATVELRDPTMVSYWITYRDTKGNVLDEVVGEGAIGGTVTPEKKSFDGYELAYTSEIKAHTLKSVNSQNMFNVTYAKLTDYRIVYHCTVDGEDLDEVTGTARYGSTVNIPQKTFEGHKLADGQKRSFKIDSDSCTVTVNYTHTAKQTNTGNQTNTADRTQEKKQYQYIVEYYDKDSNEVIHRIKGEDQADTGVRYLDAPWREDYRLADGWENYTCWLKKDNMTFRIPCVKVE